MPIRRGRESRRNYTCVLVPFLLWFTLSPLALGTEAVFAPGHVLIGGALAAAGAAYLMLLRHVRMLGAAMSAARCSLIAVSHVWIVLRRFRSPERRPPRRRLLFMMVPYLVSALGMQLMTFEDMTVRAAPHQPPARDRRRASCGAW